MTMHVEWRTKGEINDTIILVDADQHKVNNALEANPKLLTTYLNEMDLSNWQSGDAVQGNLTEPESWGELVMSRGAGGEIVDMDPELFWDGIYQWFRSRGIDPNLMSMVNQLPSGR